VNRSETNPSLTIQTTRLQFIAMRTRTALAVLGLTLAAAPAAQAADFELVRGHGTEAVTFQSDPATCGAVGRCGYAGTDTYTFSSTHGVLLKDVALLFTNGRTEARVTGPDGSTVCPDEVAHPAEELTVEHGRLIGHDPRIPVIEYLATRCVGPLEADVLGARPLFSARLPKGRRTLHLTDASTRSFTASGFTGTVTGSLTLDFRRVKIKC
jgi:hypothetical protein